MADEIKPVRPPPGLLSGAAFLMAVSAIGPGFLTQTTLFTRDLGASLACAILISTLIDIGAQLNTWRVVCISGKRGHEVADAVVPGLGRVVVAVIVAGSFCFNVGNFSGCALGLVPVLGTDFYGGAGISAVAAIALFLLPAMLAAMDWFSKGLGAAMILMTLWILAQTAPPFAAAAKAAVMPEVFDVGKVLTLVGGTIGGYIMFSGAHRLLDGGVAGPSAAAAATRASVTGIIVTGVMRTLTFLAVLGVVAAAGAGVIGKDTPVFDAFEAGAGRAGYLLSGLVYWAAAITSVVGCSYTAVSFLPGSAEPHRRAWMIVAFTAGSLAATLAARAAGWNPSGVLVAAGTVNGVLLPVLVGTVLIAAYRPALVGDYRHPWWAAAAGALALIATTVMAVLTVKATFF